MPLDLPLDHIDFEYWSFLNSDIWTQGVAISNYLLSKYDLVNDDLVQNFSDASVVAMKLLQSCTKPFI